VTKGKNNANLRNTGIKIVGRMPWGSHLCQFYHTKRDLLEILLPYFKAGLRSNEFCMWVTSDPLSAKETKDALNKEVKNLDERIKKGQIEILDYSQWYTKGGRFNADKVLADWIEKERHALRKGFSGLRLTGNTFWLEQKDWNDFTEYEAKVNNAIGGHRMLALCTYSLDKCSASQVIDVVNNHQFALIKREGKWVSVESSSYRIAIDNLKEISHKYELLIENIPLHIAAIDRTGKFIIWNKYSEELFDYKKKESLGKLEPKDLHVSYADAKNVICTAKEKGVFDGDMKLKRKDGSVVEMHLVVVPYKDSRGNIINYYGFGEDITERKQALDALSRAKEEWECTFDSLSDPIVIIDTAHRIVRANKAMAERLRCTTDQCIGNLCYRIVHSTDSPPEFCPHKQTIADGKEHSSEIYEERLGGYFLVSTAPILKENSECIGSVHVCRDITERKRAEQALEKSYHELEERVQERTRELKEANEALKITKDNLNRAQTVAHVGSWHLDIVNNILLWSDETYRIFGLDIGSLLTYDKFLSIVHPDDREYVDKSWQAALQKAPYDIEHRIVIGGKVKWVREIARVEFDKKDRAISGIGTVQDITDYKQQEENLRKLQGDLTHMSRVTTMGELTAALAHELNQPLMAIISNAQAAQRFLTKQNPDLNEIKDILADIIKDDKRASDVITKLRALLKKSELEFTALNINDVIREVISLVHSDIVINNISLSTPLDEEILLVKGDRIQLQQVVLNLILNSFEAVKNVDSKRLTIRTAQQNEKFITVSAEDSGTGIDDKNMSLIFNPFFTTKKEGLGMGLSINKAIIESHEGSLWAENNSNKGATFYFTLPIVKKIENFLDPEDATE
jgi:PAS domain S-box-containing protein